MRAFMDFQEITGKQAPEQGNFKEELQYMHCVLKHANRETTSDYDKFSLSFDGFIDECDKDISLLNRCGIALADSAMIQAVGDDEKTRKPG